MLNTIRYSQILDLVAIDAATADYLGPIQEVWADESGQIAYLSSPRGYIPLLHVAGVSTQAISTRGAFANAPAKSLHRLQKLSVMSAFDELGKESGGEASGWIEDFLFDWQTGEVTHYILAGKIAEDFGGRAVLAAEDVRTINVKAIVVDDETRGFLSSEAEGLKGFLSEKQHPVRQLVHELSALLHERVSPEDKPEIVHVKIKAVGEDVATTNHPYHARLAEATAFLHDHWQSLQQSIRRTNRRAGQALSATWKKLSKADAKTDA